MNQLNTQPINGSKPLPSLGEIIVETEKKRWIMPQDKIEIGIGSGKTSVILYMPAKIAREMHCITPSFKVTDETIEITVCKVKGKDESNRDAYIFGRIEKIMLSRRSAYAIFK